MDNFNHTESQPFYNTIQLTEPEWQFENEKSASLQSKILKVYEQNPTQEISPWQMKDWLDTTLRKNHNILSVRRSISNLKNDLKLEKTVNMRIGKEGKPEHFYKLIVDNVSEKNIYSKHKKSAGDIAIDLIKSTLGQSSLFE